jgi:hypothetical protein
MLILKADRLGTTARVPVSCPVLFQRTGIWTKEKSSICRSPVARSSRHGVSFPMNTSGCMCWCLITRFGWKSPRCDGRSAIGLV